MTTQEIRKKIAESPSAEWFNNASLVLSNHVFGYSQELNGFGAIYKYLSQEINEYEKYEKLPTEFEQNLKNIINLRNGLEAFITSHIEQNQQSLKNLWTNEISNKKSITLLTLFPHIYQKLSS